MAATLTDPAAPTRPVPDRLRWVLLAVSFALLLVVGAARPNAAQPDLLPRGWAPGPLLAFTPGPAAVTALLWTAYGVGALAVLLGLRRGAPALRGWWVPGGLGVAALLTAPFGSADHVSYLAYGRILVRGGDPWVEAPLAWAGGTDPITSRVEAPWTEEPSVYGPAAELLHALSAWLGGDVLRQGVWVWQVLVVLAWLAVRAALRATLPVDAHGRVDVMWTLNPLVVGVGVLGAHVDVVATAFLVVAVALVARRTGPGGAVAAGAVLALAASTKVTFAVGLLAVLAALWLTTDRADRAARRAAFVRGAVVTGVFLLVVLGLHLWAGPHVLDQVARSRQAVSLATPWRPLLEVLRPLVGNGAARTVVSVGAAVVAVLLAALVLRATRPADDGSGARAVTTRSVGVTTLWLLAGLELAYVLAAPYSLPWYDAPVWAALPAVAVTGVGAVAAAGRAVALVALARLAVAAAAYVPGRVLGMTPGVESLTLGFRRSVAPWLVLLVWAALVAVTARRSGDRPGSGRAVGRRRGSRSAPPTR